MAFDFDLPIVFYPKIDRLEDGTYALIITATDPSHIYGCRLTTTVLKFTSFLKAQEFVGDTQILMAAQSVVKDTAHRVLFANRNEPPKFTSLPDKFGEELWLAATHITNTGPRAGRIVVK